jgi:hypothetical protein
MQALKAVVIFMGILIVAGLGLLAYGLVTKIGGPESGKDQASDNNPASVKVNEAHYSAFGTVETELPVSADGQPGRVIDMTAEAGRLVLRVEMPDGGQSLMVFDMKTGATLGTIRLKAPK